MNHSEAHSRMAEYLEGELELGKRALLDAHIDRCDVCRREFVELRETIALLRSLPDSEPPPFLVENVMRRIREGEGQRRLSDRLRDFLATVSAPRIAVPATALIVGLLMANGNLDPSQLRIPALQPANETVQPPANRRQLVLRQVTVPDANGRAVAADETVVRSVSTDSDRGLAMRTLARPPVVGRAPRITIQIPMGGQGSRGGEASRHSDGAPRQFAASWPLVSTPGRGVPYAITPQQVRGAQQSVSPLQRSVSGVMQAGTSEVTSVRSADFGGAGPATEREQRRRAELAARLDRLVRNPTIYAVEFANLTVVEQEIWLEALAEYASEVGRGDEAVGRLRQAPNPRAQQLATALATELRLVAADERHEVASAVSER